MVANSDGDQGRHPQPARELALCVMVVKSRLVHGRACANPSISGTLGRVPVATTTAWRAVKTASVLWACETRTVEFAAQPPEPMKHCYTGLPQ